ncbi:hypothetical protein KVR01_011692 [Diaporthe batatas]|uniref:uncharacterized protein n=1 Tax=Diaporthe batatas TaxID=748121 RepID=UPI001D03EF01|nr:uncharacterized protein KVR01_011692 [Diaporthe batatas]KAG8158570.1 hypothetical protein KVR01_011692 [Diaporthe batatas]
MSDNASQGRHIVVAVDGTKQNARGIELKETTNVFRATRCIENSNSSTGGILYIPGLGVEGNAYENLKGLFWGSGIDRQICRGYEKICREYRSSEDTLILIGYSRGAFAIRCLVDLITKFGVLVDTWKAGKLGNEVPDHIRRESVNRGNIICILWDTVGAVGDKLLRLIDSGTEGGGFNYHALSLHERRKKFLPTVMRFRQPVLLKDSEQCWFVGYHGDVGGGRKKNALANLALAWALGKLRQHLEPNWAPLEGIENEPGDVWKIERRTGRGTGKRYATPRTFALGSRTLDIVWAGLVHSGRSRRDTSGKERLDPVVR